jgi:hypothetical protein
MRFWELLKWACYDESGLGGGGGAMRQPAAAPEAPKEEDPAVQKRKAARMSQQRYAQGFASTVATDRSGLGSSVAMTPSTTQTDKLG